jgi:hypothetical protein
VRALHVRWNRALAAVAKQGKVFLVEQPPATDERRHADIRQACEVLSGLRGVTVLDMGQGGVVHQQWRAGPGAAPDRGGM